MKTVTSIIFPRLYTRQGGTFLGLVSAEYLKKKKKEKITVVALPNGPISFLLYSL